MNKFVFPRYIKREDAQKVLCGWCGICENPTLEDLEECDDICPQFSQIPDGDVRPVVHSKWIPFPNDGVWDFKCDICHRIIPFGQTPDTMKYCPNCGADMRGGDGNG